MGLYLFFSINNSSLLEEIFFVNIKSGMIMKDSPGFIKNEYDNIFIKIDCFTLFFNKINKR